jgi:hypothetical protein
MKNYLKLQYNWLFHHQPFRSRCHCILFDITVYQPKIGTILDTIFYEIAKIEITVIGFQKNACSISY